MINYSYRNEQGILVVGSQHVIDALRDDLAMWKERADKAEQDARRYRWLRDQWFIWGAEFPWDGLDEESKEHLDEAIDAAIDTSSVGHAGSPNQPEPPE